MGDNTWRKSKRLAEKVKEGQNHNPLPLSNPQVHPTPPKKAKTKSERNRDYLEKVLSDPVRAEAFREKNKKRAKESRMNAMYKTSRKRKAMNKQGYVCKICVTEEKQKKREIKNQGQGRVLRTMQSCERNGENKNNSKEKA